MKRLVFLLTFCFLSICAIPQIRKIKDLENQRKKTLLEIENTNKLLLDTKKTTTNLLNRIKLLTSQISSRQNLVSVLNQEITVISNEQQRTENEIKELESELAKKQENYAIAIKGMMRKKQNSNRLIFILSGKSLGESMRRIRYMKEYSEWRNNQAEEIKEKKEELSNKKLALAKSKQEKQLLLGQRQNEQNKLVKEEETHKQEVTEANKKQKELQSELTKKQKQAAALNSQIERLIAEEVARQEREAKRIAEEKAKAERAKGKTPAATTTAPAPVTETKEVVALSNDFASNKGRFPMPVTGAASIITHFGAQYHKQWNVKTNSGGIDIQAQPGAQARSIFQGEVSRIIIFPGYNNCVIIRHGGYYTFYGNIQKLYVKQGQKVKAGESIGEVYTDPDNGTSELHFQLWKGTAKLNPEPWLR